MPVAAPEAPAVAASLPADGDGHGGTLPAGRITTAPAAANRGGGGKNDVLRSAGPRNDQDPPGSCNAGSFGPSRWAVVADRNIDT